MSDLLRVPMKSSRWEPWSPGTEPAGMATLPLPKSGRYERLVLQRLLSRQAEWIGKPIRTGSCRRLTLPLAAPEPALAASLDADTRRRRARAAKARSSRR